MQISLGMGVDSPFDLPDIECVLLWQYVLCLLMYVDPVSTITWLMSFVKVIPWTHVCWNWIVSTVQRNKKYCLPAVIKRPIQKSLTMFNNCFSFSYCFYLFWRTYIHFKKINCVSNLSWHFTIPYHLQKSYLQF